MNVLHTTEAYTSKWLRWSISRYVFLLQFLKREAHIKKKNLVLGKRRLFQIGSWQQQEGQSHEPGKLPKSPKARLGPLQRGANTPGKNRVGGLGGGGGPGVMGNRSEDVFPATSQGSLGGHWQASLYTGHRPRAARLQEPRGEGRSFTEVWSSRMNGHVRGVSGNKLFSYFFFSFCLTIWHGDDQGWNPCSLHWNHGVLTTRPPGNSSGNLS